MPGAFSDFAKADLNALHIEIVDEAVFIFVKGQLARSVISHFFFQAGKGFALLESPPL